MERNTDAIGRRMQTLHADVDDPGTVAVACGTDGGGGVLRSSFAPNSDVRSNTAINQTHSPSCPHSKPTHVDIVTANKANPNS